MPLRYYMQDQVPALMQAQSDQTFQAITGASANLGRALEKLADEHKRTNTQAKAVESFLGAMSDEDRARIGLTDMTPFKNMSAQDKIAFGQGMFQKQAFAQVSAALRETDQRIKAREAETLNMQRSPKFLSALAKYRQPQLATMPAGVEGPPNLTPGLDNMSAISRAAEETGFQLPTPALSKLLAEMEQGTDAPLNFEEDPVSGARFARHRNSVLPSGINPDRMTSVTVTDPNTGEPVELPVNPRTGQPMLRPKPPQNAPRVSPEFTAQLGKLAIGLDDPKSGAQVRAGIKAMIDSAHTLKQLDDGQRDALYQQFGIGGGQASAPGTTTAGERVMVQKDGKRFMLPRSQLPDAEKQGYKLVQ